MALPAFVTLRPSHQIRRNRPPPEELIQQMLGMGSLESVNSSSEKQGKIHLRMKSLCHFSIKLCRHTSKEINHLRMINQMIQLNIPAMTDPGL